MDVNRLWDNIIRPIIEKNMKKDIAKKIDDHWSDVNLIKQPKRIRWWQSSTIRKHVNQIVCGEPVNGNQS